MGYIPRNPYPAAMFCEYEYVSEMNDQTPCSANPYGVFILNFEEDTPFPVGTAGINGYKSVARHLVKYVNVGTGTVTLTGAITENVALPPGASVMTINRNGAAVPFRWDAKYVVYGNEASGLTAETAQAALDELQAVKAAYYTHHQDTAAAVWTIHHGLGKQPCSVTVIDSSHREVFGNIEYADADTLTVAFSGAFSGKAYIV